MLFSIVYRIIRKAFRLINRFISISISRYKLLGNRVQFGKAIDFNGIPIIDVHTTGFCTIGNNCRFNSGFNYNPIGRNQPCIIFVGKKASLNIGDNVGMSSTAIVCEHKITIGNNVKIGGGVCIYDTDFHSLNAAERHDILSDKNNALSKEVIIEEDVFIGAHSTILKGVIIGKNSIIGACSTITKSIPPNEIWAGNPAKFIKKTI
jgi:acetyltransferase-like isoleucine patch superfamily enzyme